MPALPRPLLRAAAGAAAATLVALALPALPARAETARPPDGPTRCDAGAWTNNDWPGPIPVRAAPSDTAPVIGHLPTTDRGRDPAHAYSIGFTITGTVPGWLRITGAADRDAASPGIRAREVPPGEGWIPDGAARFGLQSGRGHARPDPGSPRLLDLAPDWVTEFARIERVLGCEGPWILVEARLHRERLPNDALVELPPERRQRIRAWFRGHCPIEETTCDMRPVDE